MAEKEKHAIEVRLGASPVDASVLINGQDVTPLLSGIECSSKAGELTKLVLTVAPFKAVVSVVGAFSREQVDVV